MITKRTLHFSDGRIAQVEGLTSPVVFFFLNDERYLFAQDFNDRLRYVEVGGQFIGERDLEWVQ